MDTSFFSRASCAGLDVDLFFPDSPEVEARAKAVCAACPVRRACLDRAMARGERHGVWGGLTAAERRVAARRAAPAGGHRRPSPAASHLHLVGT